MPDESPKPYAPRPGVIPTCWVRDADTPEPFLINAADFDPVLHTAVDEDGALVAPAATTNERTPSGDPSAPSADEIRMQAESLIGYSAEAAVDIIANQLTGPDVAAVLDATEAIERAGKDRVTVLRAIEARRAALAAGG